MSISTVNSYVDTTTSTTTTSSSSSTSDLGLTSSDFLSLMVEQLQNQNPTDPTDTDAYLDKLVSFASYDTQSEISDQLSTIVDSISGTLSSSGLGYVGQTVEATGNTTSLSDGEAQWSYTLDSEATSVTVNILDESGDVVYSESGETSSGKHYFTWDGTTSDGTQLADGGTYTISVEATDEDGDDVDGETTVIGTVSGVDLTDDDPVLMIGSASVLIDNVQSVLAA